MINYNGIECPVCKQAFKENDDIVVCPECGTPYHRDCYKATGHCLFEDKHGSFTFQNKNNEFKEDDNTTNINEVIVCPRCFNKNPKEAKSCEKCNLPLGPINIQSNGIPNQVNSNLLPNIFDPMGNVNEEEDFDGVSAKELASFIGINTAYYLPIFKNIKDSGRKKFNFSAFLFSGGWFLYRKQYKIGSIITVLMFVLIISSICIQMLYNTPMIISMLKAASVDLDSNLLSNNQLIYSSLMQQIIPLSAFDKFMLISPTIISFIEFLIMMFCGNIANKKYMLFCKESVSKIKTQAKADSAINKVLSEKGGVNKAVALSVLACYLIIVYFLKFALI